MKSLTVKDLRKATEGLPDDAPIFLYNSNGVCDHYEHLDILDCIGYVCSDGSGGIWWEHDEPLPNDFESDGTRIIRGLILTDSDAVRYKDLSDSGTPKQGEQHETNL